MGREEKHRNRPTHSSLAPLTATLMAQYLVLPLGALKVYWTAHQTGLINIKGKMQTRKLDEEKSNSLSSNEK